ncbi:RNA recognition motif domain [Macleaya cordata]|uniref:RNA recognition motif domain n=1 Tax=Macleaya cordata TaxID=56857 RepID=A0A200QXC5_MACCD|nr:RNA recognition motif domain [Macleaya cordata]
MESDHGKLFIGGISWDTNEDRLKEYFKTYGEVVEAVIMKDRTTGRARGFGFVVFADPAVAERVVMDKHLIDGRTVEAKKAVPRDDQQIMNRSSSSIHGSPGPTRTKKIFVGGLASTVTESDFKKYFDQFGTITDVVVMYDHNTQRPRGFGFITYDSEDAVEKVLLKTFHELNGKMVEVKRAVPKELSPGPNRSVLGGYNYSLNRVNSFLSGYNQGFSPSSIGGYGVRMDRFSPVAGSRSGFSPFGPSGFGMGVNFDQAVSPSYGGNANFSSSFGYGRGLNPYYGGISSRYGSSFGYGGGNEGIGSALNSTTRNVWGDGGLSYPTSSASSGAYMGSGGGSIGGGAFGGNNTGANWGSSSISAQAGGSGSSYSIGNLGYGNGDSNYGLGGGGYGRNSGTSVTTPSYATSNGVPDGSFEDLYGGGSIYGDPWRSATSELDGSDSFGYGLGSAASDVASKGSAAFIGGYSVTNRQANRGYSIGVVETKIEFKYAINPINLMNSCVFGGLAFVYSSLLQWISPINLVNSRLSGDGFSFVLLKELLPRRIIIWKSGNYCRANRSAYFGELKFRGSSYRDFVFKSSAAVKTGRCICPNRPALRSTVQWGLSRGSHSSADPTNPHCAADFRAGPVSTLLTRNSGVTLARSSTTVYNHDEFNTAISRGTMSLACIREGFDLYKFAYATPNWSLVQLEIYDLETFREEEIISLQKLGKQCHFEMLNIHSFPGLKER